MINAPEMERSAEAQEAGAPTIDPSEPVKANRPVTQFHGPDGTKKMRPRPAMRAAISEVVARKAAGWPPDYRIIAEKHSVNRGSLETLTRRYNKGLIDLGDSPTAPTSTEVDLRAEVQRSMFLLKRYERHLNTAFEELLKKADTELKQGNFLAFDQLGLPKVVNELTRTTGLRAKKEKGVFEILEKLNELQGRREQAALPKTIGGTVVDIAPKPAGNQGLAAALSAGSHQQTIRDALANPTE